MMHDDDDNFLFKKPDLRDSLRFLESESIQGSVRLRHVVMSCSK